MINYVIHIVPSLYQAGAIEVNASWRQGERIYGLVHPYSVLMMEHVPMGVVAYELEAIPREVERMAGEPARLSALRVRGTQDWMRERDRAAIASALATIPRPSS